MNDELLYILASFGLVVIAIMLIVFLPHIYFFGASTISLFSGNPLSYSFEETKECSKTGFIVNESSVEEFSEFYLINGKIYGKQELSIKSKKCVFVYKYHPKDWVGYYVYADSNQLSLFSLCQESNGSTWMCLKNE